MRHLLGVLIVGAALTAGSGLARAQFFGGMTTSYSYSMTSGVPFLGGVTRYGYGSYFGAPGYYGVAYGYPSLGFPRTYTAFSSPYGAGYGYGYAPAYPLPGPYGVGLWRPGFAVPGYVYGASYYGTFPVPYRPWVGYGPALGYYAPGFGPPSYYGW